MPDVIVRKSVNLYREPKFKESYKMNDLDSVFTHWDPEQGKNVPTLNILGGKING